MSSRRIVAPLLASFLALAPVGAHALDLPHVTLSAGKSLGVSGLPSEGGFTTTAALTWPVMGRFHFGVAGWADDLGTELTRLVNPANGADIGASAQSHRWAWGLGWIGETTLAGKGSWNLDGSVGWGFHRVEDDERGLTTRALSSVSTNATLAARRRLAPGQSLGLSIRWQQVFLDRDETGSGAAPTFAPTTPIAVQQRELAAWELQRRSNLPTGWASAALEYRWARN